MRSCIKGTGMYVPENVVDNHRLSRLMDTSDEWIRKRTGIVTRHFADPEQAASDLAVPACRRALEAAGLEAGEIDYLIFATMSPDFYIPGSGAVLQRKLGLGQIPCLDIRQQCTGFLHAMQVADSLVRSGTCRNVLVVGSEVHGGFMPWKSWDAVLGRSDDDVPEEEFTLNTRYRDRVVLFGDAAGAFVISRAEEGDGGFDDFLVKTDGEHLDKMWVKAGGSAFRPYFDPAMTASGDAVPVLEGREVFKLAVTRMPEAVIEILGKHGLALDDVSLVVMHQANLRINEAVQKRLGLPDEKVLNNVQRYGNTTSATLPLVFHEAREQGRLGRGDRVCFAALGGGLTWGAALYRY